MNVPTIVDLFAGPGGWDIALADRPDLGVVGIELDAAACDTRATAGLRTIRADVAEVPVERFAGIDGMIGSPPCQGWSSAGRRKSIDDGAALREHAIRCHRGWIDPEPPGPGWADERSPLALEPLRWALTLRPRWVALEQVPAVLPLWQAVAVALETAGYSTAAATVNAADYGVPQTRKRAVLLARLDGPARIPRPTHRGRWSTIGDALTVPPGTVLNTGRDWKRGGTRADAQTIDPNQPAPTVAGVNSQWQWWRDGRSVGLVTVEEAATLQTFPPGYRFAGTTEDRWQQVGNAVPPTLAAALLAPLLPERCNP